MDEPKDKVRQPRKPKEIKEKKIKEEKPKMIIEKKFVVLAFD